MQSVGRALRGWPALCERWMSVNGSVRTENSSLDKRVHDLVTKEAARADKLQHRLDEERAVSAALRQQLKSSTGTQQHLTQQLRALQGAPGVPGGTRDGHRSVPQLERQISKLQDQLDLEKKATNAERLGRQRLAAQLSDQTAAQARLEAARDELQRTVARKGAELRRAHDLLREGGQAQDSALAELSTVKERHERHQTRPSYTDPEHLPFQLTPTLATILPLPVSLTLSITPPHP